MKIHINKEKVGNRINKIRISNRYTLEEFGKLFDTSKSNVHRWENGQAIPNKSRIEKIALQGKITVNELLYGNVEEFTRANIEGILTIFSENQKEYIIKEVSKNTTLDINYIDKIISYIENRFDYFINPVLSEWESLPENIDFEEIEKQEFQKTSDRLSTFFNAKQEYISNTDTYSGQIVELLDYLTTTDKKQALVQIIETLKTYDMDKDTLTGFNLVIEKYERLHKQNKEK